MAIKCIPGLGFIAILMLPIFMGQPGFALQREGLSSQVVIDATAPPSPPEALPFAIAGDSSNGHILSANTRYLTLDGKPWFPVMGEFHFSRYPDAGWEQEILRMKANGIQIVSTYIFWIHHEEIEGQFDWTGQRDLRLFVQLCAKHGMYVWIRVGPWDHGEARNGGLPDWLLRKTPTRQDDPLYLEYVRRFYGEIGAQLKGLFWKDSGPVIGVQLENEYAATGAGKGAEHILSLLRLAREGGLDAPFYSVTAWDAAVIPPRGVLPVFGGYADGFWWRSVGELPPNPNYFFTKIRCEENVGEDLRSKHPEIDALRSGYPYLTAEMGAGMESSYHRRPLISVDDTAAMEVVKLGSGVTMYGYYMFHGGANPEGKTTDLQETQATGYPNDLPIKSYEFQAPLGEFGEENQSFRVLKAFHLFLEDFGAELAPMTPYFPEQMPESKHDIETPRVAVRAKDSAGFIFINNYERTYHLPEHKNFQVRMKLPSDVIDVPRHPITLPSGAYTIWPVNLDLHGALLRYATAQLLCKLNDPKTFVFFATPGIAPEFAIEEPEGNVVEAAHARVRREGRLVYIDEMQTGEDAAIRIRSQGAETSIIVLSQEQALNLWKATIEGRPRFLLSPAEIFADENRVHMLSTDPAGFRLGVFPKLEHAPDGFSEGANDGIFQQLVTSVENVRVKAQVHKLKNARDPAPIKLGKEVALAPAESDFDKAAQWSIRVPNVDSKALKNLFVKITYEGDVARIYSGDRFVTDDFYHGAPRQIGLEQASGLGSDPELRIEILPLRRNAPIYLAPEARPAFRGKRAVARLKKVDVIPQYEVVMNPKP